MSKWTDNYEEYQNAACQDNSDYPVYRGKKEKKKDVTYPEPEGCKIATEDEVLKGDWVVDDR